MLPDKIYGCHLFVGRQLPGLKQICIGREPDEDDEWPEVHGDLPDTLLDDVGVARMAACCPAIERLVLPGCLVERVQLAPLLQLTALTELFLAGDEITDEFAVEQLATLTRLEQLSVSLTEFLTDFGVKHLTALTRLSRLSLKAVHTSAGMSILSEDQGYMHLMNLPVGVSPSLQQHQGLLYCVWRGRMLSVNL
jgi:hypothetical protein